VSLAGFVHPALAWGLAAAAVPILIHLLNRRRYRRLPWAASVFLLAAYRRTRRRMRLENFLLLLARTAAVALLALAIARPYAGVQGPVAALAESRRDEVVVVDASYSMGYRGEAGSTPWERGLEAAREILERAHPERGDRVALVLAKGRPEEVRTSGREDLRRELARLAEEGPPQQGSDFRATLAFVDRVLDGFGAGGSSTVTFVTDLQRRAFAPPSTPSSRPAPRDGTPASAPVEPPGSDEIALRLRSIAERGARLRVLPVGPSDAIPPNLGVTSLRPDPPDQGFFAGAEARFEATVRNHGRETRAGVLVRFLVDGNPKGAVRVDLPPGADHPVHFSETFLDSGGHAVEVVLESDGLQPDDRRGYALLVRPPIRVLLVEGEPVEDPELAETGPFLAALEPPEEGRGGESPPFLPTAVDRSRFNTNQENLGEYDAVVLPNVESLTDEVVARLETWVAAGGALLISLGDRVNPDYYNARFRPPEGGTGGGGLLPAKIGELRSYSGREGTPFRLVLRDPHYPPFRFFTEDPQNTFLLENASVFRFFSVEPDEGTLVPAVYSDPGASPALVEKRLGRGRVALLTTRARPEWWPLVARWPVVPFVFDLLRYLTAPDPSELERAVGEPLRLVADRSPLRAWVADALGRRSPLAGSPRPAGPDRWVIPEVADTARAGIYAIELELPARLGTTETRMTRFAVNVDPAEGDLRQIEGAEAALATFFPGAAVELAGAAREREEGKEEEGRGEFWRALAAACLGFLLAESALAAFVGRRRA
jgi:hypothetical protein